MVTNITLDPPISRRLPLATDLWMYRVCYHGKYWKMDKVCYHGDSMVKIVTDRKVYRVCYDGSSIGHL